MDENHVRTIVQEILHEHSSIFWKELFIALLNSPVIILIIVLFIVWIFKDKLINILSSRNIEIGWGDKSIKLNELSNNLDQEIDPVKEQIEELRQELKKIKGQQEIEPVAGVDKAKLSNEDIKSRINKALSSPKFRWRTLDSLAKLASASHDEVLEMLEADEAIVIGRGKNGETLAKFKHR